MEYGYTAWVSNFVQNRPFCVYYSISCTPEEIFYTYFIGGISDKYEVCLYEVFEYSMKYEYSMKGTDDMVRNCNDIGRKIHGNFLGKFYTEKLLTTSASGMCHE